MNVKLAPQWHGIDVQCPSCKHIGPGDVQAFKENPDRVLNCQKCGYRFRLNLTEKDVDPLSPICVHKYWRDEPEVTYWIWWAESAPVAKPAKPFEVEQ